jgi:uncharacterized protein (TIGR00369 family)
LEEFRMRDDLRGDSPFGELVGRNIVGADADGKAIEVEYAARQEFTNRIGTISGGMLSAMLDSVTGLAALLVVPAESTAVHTELKVEYLRAARPGRLTGRARVVEHVARDIRAEGELHDAEGNVVARGVAKLRMVHKKRA